MSYQIINAIPIATMNELNTRFDMRLSRVQTAERWDIGDYKDRELEAVKKLMESNTEVTYDRNTY